MENRSFHKAVPDLTLDNQILKEVLSGKSVRTRSPGENDLARARFDTYRQLLYLPVNAGSRAPPYCPDQLR